MDTNLLIAIITLVGAIVGAIIGGMFMIYQARHQHKLMTKHEVAQEKQKTLELQKVTEMQEKMLEQTILQQAQYYREAIGKDHRITYLQLLETKHTTMAISTIYVRQRVINGGNLAYKVSPFLQLTEDQNDPNLILQREQHYLKQRFSSNMDPIEAIQKYKHCVIMGDPGAGKTTLLRHLALESAQGRLSELPDLPILIELNAFAHSDEHDLLDFAAKTCEKRYSLSRNEFRLYMESQLKEGKALLLLDGLDETTIGKTGEAADNSYARVVDAIMNITSRYTSSPVVVTARTATYQQKLPLDGFTRLEVSDFRLEDIREFVNKWFDASEDTQALVSAYDLLLRLERNPRILALAANPLLLSLIVVLYESQLELPEDRAKLYNRVVDALLKDWDQKRNVRRRRLFQPEHKRQLLEEIALHFHLEHKRYFPKREVLKLIDTFLLSIRVTKPSNDMVLEEIVSDNGLLKEQAKDWYNFLHLTLQEFFVAMYAFNHDQLDMLLQHLYDPWWEEVLLLYAGSVRDASTLIQTLLQKDSEVPLQEDIFYTNLLTAGRCIAANPRIPNPSLVQEVIDRLFVRLRETPYIYLKEQISLVLTAIGSLDSGAEVNNRLLEILTTEDADFLDLRICIADAICMSGNLSIVNSLLKMLAEQDVHWYVRSRIARTLGTLGQKSVASTLLSLLADENDHRYVRGCIATALGTLNQTDVTPALLKLLVDEKVDFYVRGNIAIALGTLCRQSTTESQNLLLDEHVHDYIRGRIVTSLGVFGNQTVIPTLMHLLQDKNTEFYVRRSVATALGGVGEQSVVGNLLELLSDETLEPDIRGSIAATLGALNERSVIPQLLSFLSNENVAQEVRRNIALALGMLSDKKTIPVLLDIVKQNCTDRYVCGSIVTALGMMEYTLTVPDLLELLADSHMDRYVRQCTTNALAQLADSEECVQKLVQLFPTSDIGNDLYRTLHIVSQRAKVRILPAEAHEEQRFTIIKW